MSFDLLGFAGGLLDTGVNLWNSERNISFAKKNLDWQKYVQNQTWQREDTAVRRRAADLKAAGFNPLLAAGGAASSGQAVSTTAPQGSAKTEFAANILALKRMEMDLSMTRAQQQLINSQADVARQNASLLNKQNKWYEDHPEFAPGVESGPYTGKGFLSIFDAVSNRIAARREYGKASDGKLSRRAIEFSKRADVQKILNNL